MFSKKQNSATSLVDKLVKQASEAIRLGESDGALCLLERVFRISPKRFDALLMLGILEMNRRQPDAALRYLDLALELNRNNHALHFNRGNVLNECGRHEEAIASYDRAIELNPAYVMAYCNRGNVEQALGFYERALVSYGLALQLDSAIPELHLNRGAVLRKLGRLEESLFCYEQALQLNPGLAPAYNNIGFVLNESARHAEALDYFDKALQLSPNYAEAYSNKGSAYHALNQLEEALGCYDRAIAINPRFARALSNKGNIMREIGCFEQALDCHAQAIALEPNFAEAHCNQGVTLQEMKRYEEALQSYDRAVALSPGLAIAHNNRGYILREQGRLGEAMDSYDRAIAIKPDYAEAFGNRGALFKDLGEIDQSIRDFDHAITLNADLPEVYWNKSLALLSSEQFEFGWDLYEWRFKKKIKLSKKSNWVDYPIQLPQWDGQPLQPAEALLVLPEQGIGDQIFYAGMFPAMQERGENLHVAVDRRLLALFKRSFPKINFVSSELDDVTRLVQDRPEIRYKIYCASLGKFLRKSPESFRDVELGYLRPNTSQVAALQTRLREHSKKICGLSWSSKNADFGSHKSLSLANLESILKLPGYSFVNLQYGDVSAEIEEIMGRTGCAVATMRDIDNFNDIDGLASLICACDVVVTVSNTTAHLAAALGRPVRILLPAAAGLLYYWHLRRHDSPWYPSAKLYRQSRMASWEEPVAQLHADLVLMPDPVNRL